MTTMTTLDMSLCFHLSFWGSCKVKSPIFCTVCNKGLFISRLRMRTRQITNVGHCIWMQQWPAVKQPYFWKRSWKGVLAPNYPPTPPFTLLNNTKRLIKCELLMDKNSKNTQTRGCDITTLKSKLRWNIQFYLIRNINTIKVKLCRIVTKFNIVNWL